MRFQDRHLLDCVEAFQPMLIGVRAFSSVPAGAAASGNLVATYHYGTEGLEVYVPGSGILFKEGINLCAFFRFSLVGARISIHETL